jgi:hypothetical protein
MKEKKMKPKNKNYLIGALAVIAVIALIGLGCLIGINLKPGEYSGKDMNSAFNRGVIVGMNQGLAIGKIQVVNDVILKGTATFCDTNKICVPLYSQKYVQQLLVTQAIMRDKNTNK